MAQKTPTAAAITTVTLLLAVAGYLGFENWQQEERRSTCSRNIADARLACQSKRYADAEKLLAAATTPSVISSTSKDQAAEAFNILGQTYLGQNEPLKAQSALMQAISICEAELPKRRTAGRENLYFQYAKSLIELSKLEQRRGNQAEAKKLLNKAGDLANLPDVSTDTHELIQQSYHALADDVMAGFLQRGMTRQIDTVDENVVLLNKADCRQAERQYAAAEALYKQALDRTVKAGNVSQLCHAVERLARLYAIENMPGRSEALFLHYEPIVEKLDTERFRFGRYMAKIALFYRMQKAYDKAEAAAKRAFEVHSQSAWNEQIDDFDQLVSLYTLQKKYEPADKLCKEMQACVTPRDDVIYVRVLDTCATYWMARGRMKEAKTLLDKALSYCSEKESKTALEERDTALREKRAISSALKSQDRFELFTALESKDEHDLTRKLYAEDERYNREQKLLRHLYVDCLCKVAEIYQNSKDLNTAEKCYEKAMSIRQDNSTLTYEMYKALPKYINLLHKLGRQAVLAQLEPLYMQSLRRSTCDRVTDRKKAHTNDQQANNRLQSPAFDFDERAKTAVSKDQTRNHSTPVAREERHSTAASENQLGRPD